MKITMRIPPKKKSESLVGYAERLSTVYSSTFASNDRKPRGQFFTPEHVSGFMAGLFEINIEEINVLDPGAGVGILSAAFCEKILRIGKPVSLGIDAFENDPNVIPNHLLSGKR